MLVLRFVLAAALIGQAAAQELDTTIRSSSRVSILQTDKFGSIQERNDFIALYRQRNPTLRHKLAEQFIECYPQSWFLAEAYGAEAKASIDLGQYDQGTDEARAALKFLPENPLLLVPLANIEAKEKLFEKAERDAKNALEYLDTFAAPSGLSAAEWQKLKAQLMSSADFALGQAYAAQALSLHGTAQRDRLQKAQAVLSSAVGLNREDPEIFYLRGLVEELSGANGDAASDLLQAEKQGPFLRSRIAPMLHRIFNEGHGVSFESFLRSIGPPRIPPAAANLGSSGGRVDIPGTAYAGSAVCAECHRKEYDAWKKTGMARMLRAYQPENVMGEFGPQVQFQDESGTVKMGDDKRPFFEVQDSVGQWHKFFVDYTIGSKWQQAYVTKLPDGRLQVLPVQYNSIHHEWVNYWRLLDPPGSVRADISKFPELLPETNYQENCSVCHTSPTRPIQQEGDINFVVATTYREMGIDCEMCHGPSTAHVEAMRGKGKWQLPVEFAKIGNREEIRICSQCHRQSLIRDSSYRFNWNEWMKYGKIPSPGLSRPYPEFSRLATYKDGRFRQTTFIVEAFTRSACYRVGGAKCTSCHNPHPVDAGRNPTSLKFRGDPDRMCLQCHTQFAGRIEQHTHHPVGSAASRCTACHMPRIMDSLLARAMYHQIDDIPDAQMTERFGEKDSPNACLLCHTGKDGSWVARELSNWNTPDSVNHPAER